MTEKLDEKGVLEALYNGCQIDKLYIDDEVYTHYNDTELDLGKLPKEPTFSGEYFYPIEYNLSKEQIMNKYKHKCANVDELNRFEEELEIFDMIGKLDLINYFIYLVDVMNRNKIIWGVGRGSSVSIFVFYLIGVHKVNCVKYNIEYTDFFKIKGDN